MSAIVAAAPLDAPVFRMRVELVCRDLDTAAHRAVERLHDLGVAAPHIAALLGLRIEQVESLQAQLDGSAGAHRRTLRVWVDPVHQLVMSTEQGLDLVRPSQHGPRNPVLDVEPPRAAELPRERFARAAARSGLARARIAVDDVQELDIDLPTPDAPARRNDRDHVMLLSDTTLIVRDGAHGPVLEMRWEGVEDPALTKAAQAKLLHDHGLDPTRLTTTAAHAALERLRAALGATPDEASALQLDPDVLQDRLMEQFGHADEQLLVAIDAPRSDWPYWLKQEIGYAQSRGVECVERARNRTGLDDGCRMLIVRDRRWAVAHSEALLLGRAWRLRSLASQACLDVHDPATVERLLQRLEVPPRTHRRARRPSPRIEDVGAQLLREQLKALCRQLPEINPVVGDGDVAAFCAAVKRYHRTADDHQRLSELAQGVAWERVLHTHCTQIEARHPHITVKHLRLPLPGASLDIDMVVTDHDHRIWWALDAKSGKSKTDHPRQLKRQLDIARAQGHVQDGWETRGAFVHPNNTHDLKEQTSEDDIVCWRLNQVEDRLLHPQ
jgi:hypothetical protein